MKDVIFLSRAESVLIADFSLRARTGAGAGFVSMCGDCLMSTNHDYDGFVEYNSITVSSTPWVFCLQMRNDSWATCQAARLPAALCKCDVCHTLYIL